MDEARLPADLIRLAAPREGHFLLESGHHGTLWLDLDRLFLTPRAIAPFARAMGVACAHHAVEVVCGPLTGGAFVAQMVAAELDCAFAYSERVPRQSADGLYPVGYRIPDAFRDAIAGRRVAVVDDAINAGSAVGGTLRAVRAMEAVPVVVGALLDLDGARTNPVTFDGLPIVSLARLPGQRWVPDTCPLCAANVPLERIASD